MKHLLLASALIVPVFLRKEPERSRFPSRKHISPTSVECGSFVAFVLSQSSEHLGGKAACRQERRSPYWNEALPTNQKQSRNGQGDAGKSLPGWGLMKKRYAR